MHNSREKIKQYHEAIIVKLKSKINSYEKLSKRYSLIRLLVFISATTIFLSCYLTNYKTVAFISAGILGLVFVVLMNWHSKIEKSIKRFKQYSEIKKENLARINIDWDNIPFNKKLLQTSPTTLEQDLNITERMGLLHLVNTGISFESIEFLRDWLGGNDNNVSRILNRQKTISELKDLARFRDKLSLTSRLSLKNVEFGIGISDWLKKEKSKKGLNLFTTVLSGLCIINIIALVGYWMGLFETYYYQALLIYLLVYFSGYRYVKDIKDTSVMLYEEVRKYSSIFNFIETYNYGKSDKLRKLLSPFLVNKPRPSKVLGSINFTIEVFNLGLNPFIWFALICILPIDYLLAIKVERFKKSIKVNFPGWLETFHKLEAYSSLATFAYLNPEYSFPKFENENELITSLKLGHPLIKAEDRIDNDFIIGEDNKTNIVTGSNMSGKSTFLRTVGINTLLAYSGSVVCAEKFVCSNFKLYSCIKVSDSVVDGISYFYAEVKRLKSIVDAIIADENKSLVLIDEIYKGTNNVERLEGSRALIKYLSKQNIYSIISTHDLEMVNIADELNSTKNFHFKENIEKNKMYFNYKLMDGPCPTTNALKIMELEGLPT